MLYFFRLLLLLINIDQEIVIGRFGVKTSNLQNSFSKNNVNSLFTEIYSIVSISEETLKVILKEMFQRVQDGLTLADIENILFFILFIRFIILAIRYNLKTSFLITCIGLFAGYLWYRHLIDLILVVLFIIISAIISPL